ncbi:purine-nucleoside phosphorylase [Enterococcus hirae]|jgi:purine-nucleoside phosphorylase|nr:purine-nucleoside phosphorylase [Enterococcaceae bacterium]MDM8214207.1 purine-nucleoside phosphorylase [Enterococcus hirae]
MSVHIGAKDGEIADKILLPGDPLRAKFIAENFLEDAKCYNEVRGMLGYTGTYKGERISVQGTGMGLPSISIYVNELIRFYGVKKLIRVGTAGAISREVHVRDLVLGQAAATTSAMVEREVPSYHYPPTADFGMLKTAFEIATKAGLPTHVGTILSSDAFYNDELDRVLELAKLGVYAVEMEAAALYYLARKFHVQALTILTISDHMITGEETTAAERQTTFKDMMEVGLETLLKS